MQNNDIQTYRAEIDAIDELLIDLLKKRSAWVRKVGAAKALHQQKGTSFIRAGREAAMVRRMYDAFADKSFPPAAAAQMWRIIISASLSLESNLSIAAFSSPENQSLYWLAREYFGSFNPITSSGTLAEVLNTVSSGHVQAGVLPLPSASAPWWLDLPEKVCVFACIPFLLGVGETIEGLAIARAEPEPTGDDITLLRIISSDFDIARKIPPAITLLDSAALQDKKYACLIQVDGFHQSTPSTLLELHDILAIEVLGAYAKPIILHE